MSLTNMLQIVPSFFLRERESINYTVQAQLMLTALSIWVNAQYDKFK